MAQNIHAPDVSKSQKKMYNTTETFCETDDFMPPQHFPDRGKFLSYWHLLKAKISLDVVTVRLPVTGTS